MPFSDIIGHQDAKTKLRGILARDHLAHAYLFYGDDAIGKRRMGLCFAQAFVCESTTEQCPTQDPCGHCRGCQQLEQGLHPDTLLIEPDREKANPQITIDRVRDLEHHTLYRPLYGWKKVCLINDADCLTLGAANALLKTLEEPPLYSLFILITSKPSALPATIRSRCLALRFASPSTSDVEGALALKRAMPESDARFLARLSNRRIGQALEANLEEARATQEEFFSLVSGTALQSVAQIFDTTERLAKAGRIPEALDWLTHALRDLLLVSLDVNPQLILDRDHMSGLQRLVALTTPEALINLIEELQGLERSRSRNVNLQLGLENFFLKLRGAIPV